MRNLLRRGFTLLEVMVALSILAIALTALSGISANSFESSNYANFVTVATLLARSKMIDVEEELRKDGLGDDEKTFHGDFSEEGYPKVKWKAVCRPIEVDIAELVGNLFGGDLESEDFPDHIEEYISAFSGGGADAELSENVAGSEFAKMLGGGHLEGILKQVGETLGKSIREITLEIEWVQDRKYTESIKFVQYVVTSGRLAVPQGPISLPNLPSAPGHRNQNTAGATLGGQPLGGQPTPQPNTNPGSTRIQIGGGKP